MKRKKSTQLLAVALTAAMLAQPVGAQMVFAEGNADVVQQEQAVSPAAETTGAVLKSGTAVIPANADLNQVKAILGKTLVENADQVNLSSLADCRRIRHGEVLKDLQVPRRYGVF